MKCLNRIIYNGEVYIPESAIINYSRIVDEKITSFIRADADLYSSLYFLLTDDREVGIVVDSMKGKGHDVDFIIPKDAPMFIRHEDDFLPLTKLESEHLVLAIIEFTKGTDLRFIFE